MGQRRSGKNDPRTDWQVTMNNRKKISLPVVSRFLLLVSCLSFLVSFSQTKHRVMLVPFEPKLYMSQVDHKFNAETKQSQKQIRETFRKGVNKELESTFKKNYEVIDMLKDTAKYGKDLSAIYKNLTYSFDKVPDQSNYKAPVSDKNKQDNIKKGQLVVETDPNARFMNARITNPSLVPGLFTRYKTDVFLFITQLDIISTTVGTGETGTLTERTITLHYSAYSVDAKEIQAGICSLKIPGDVNTPSKIVSSYISKIAAEVTRRITVALTKKDAQQKEKEKPKEPEKKKTN
jgi:hypothetical protein